MPAAPNPVIVAPGSQQADRRERLDSYPVLSAGTLFIHAGNRIMALSANAGSFLWSYPPPGSAAAAAPPDAPNENPMVAAQMQMLQDDSNPFRAAAHRSVAVDGDRVYAVLPAPRQRAPSEDDSGAENPFMPSSRVVCLDRTTGGEKWSTAGQALKLDNKGTLTFVGSPLVTRHGVFVMARKVGESAFVQLYLIRLDPETGDPAWSCYLCSASSGAYFGPMITFSNIPVPTFADDMLYVSTGQGADCAIDANAGRIVWLEITSTAKKARSPQDYFNQSARTPSWKFNPPLVHGDMLITQESVGNESLIH